MRMGRAQRAEGSAATLRDRLRGLEGEVRSARQEASAMQLRCAEATARTMEGGAGPGGREVWRQLCPVGQVTWSRSPNILQPSPWGCYQLPRTTPCLALPPCSQQDTAADIPLSPFPVPLQG